MLEKKWTASQMANKCLAAVGRPLQRRIVKLPDAGPPLGRHSNLRISFT